MEYTTITGVPGREFVSQRLISRVTGHLKKPKNHIYDDAANPTGISRMSIHACLRARGILRLLHEGR